MNTQRSKVAVITGASHGIGLAVAKLLSERGFKCYSLSRGECPDPRVTSVKTDVTDEDGMISAIEEIANQNGNLDLLVCNAGMGISGAVEYTEAAEAKRQMNVNFFGFFNTVKAALPYMQRGAHIIAVSSVAAIIPIPFQAFYSASKAAINSLARALAIELKPFGISVSAVMPGDVKTDFTAARRKSLAGSDRYGGVIERSVASMEKDEQGGMPPEKVAAVILKAASTNHPRPLYIAGKKYRLFGVLVKILPTSLVQFIVRKIYAK